MDILNLSLGIFCLMLSGIVIIIDFAGKERKIDPVDRFLDMLIFAFLLIGGIEIILGELTPIDTGEIISATFFLVRAFTLGIGRMLNLIDMPEGYPNSLEWRTAYGIGNMIAGLGASIFWARDYFESQGWLNAREFGYGLLLLALVYFLLLYFGNNFSSNNPNMQIQDLQNEYTHTMDR